jgi:hypothetical protein
MVPEVASVINPSILSPKIRSIFGSFGLDSSAHASWMRTSAQEVCGHNLVGQDPSDSKSNRSHVDIFQCCFHSFGAYSIDSSKMLGNSHEVSNFNRLFLKLNRFNCN